MGNFISKIKEFFKYAIKWFFYNGHVLIPLLYFMLVLVSSSINFEIELFAFFFLLGMISRYLYKSILRNEFKTDLIDEETIDDGFSYKSHSSFVEWIKGMSYWEIIHWVLVLVFLGLTCYAMINGLKLLFIQNSVTNIFIIIFSITVTLTLGWLILMIANNARWLWYLIFYLVFDLLSAFSFNFVHFYDNISYTQRMDSDMKAYRMYKDIQLNNVNTIYLITENEKQKITEQNKEINEKINEYKDDNIDLYNEIDEINIELDLNENDTTKNIQNRSNRNKRFEKQKKIKENKKEITRLQNDLKSEAFVNSLCKSAEDLKTKFGELEKLCVKYNDRNSSFDGISDLELTKKCVSDIQQHIESFTSHDLYKDRIIATNDTIEFVFKKIKRNEVDKFASLKNLFNTIAELISPTTLSEGNMEALSPLQFLDKEEKGLEKRLLLLSIMLSILIDLAPLALGIFVSRQKFKNQHS